jgi:hypothetical protein
LAKRQYILQINPNTNYKFPILDGRNTTVAPFLTTAHNTFDGIIASPWQRDNIYYRLTPTQTTNSFVGGKYREAITYFQLAGDPNTVFSVLATQQNGANPDPQYTNQDWSRNKRAPWTDGNFEIGISITDNSKLRPSVNTALVFDAKADDLFTYTHQSVTRRRGFLITWPRTYYKPIITGFKGMSFLSNNINSTKLHTNTWDLSIYSHTWTYEFKEIDVTTEIVTATSESRKYSTNIGIDASFPLGDKIKIGLKWGSTTEETQTFSRNQKWVEGSNLLGFVDVPFYDKIVIKNPCNNSLYPRLYSNSRVVFEIRPVQVEF